MHLRSICLPFPTKRVRDRFAPWLAGVALALGCTAPAAWAQTPVSGAIDANVRWTEAASPYLVNGDVTVQGGATLTIDAGVTVSMAAGARLTVQAGSVRMNGTVDKPVRVRSDKRRVGQPAQPGDWDQWVFGPGTVDTQLDHAVIEDGRGIAVFGSAPVFNHLEIRGHDGAAITIDLAASPVGVGIRASGNALNGIAVPAGDIGGNVRWGLRGIPYVVPSGVLSVGASPAVAGVVPRTVEQGETLTLAINGSRLDGASAFAFDHAGLAVTPFSGGSSSQVFVQLQVDTSAPLGPRTLTLQTDAGRVSVADAVTVTQPMPAIAALSPSIVLAGAGASEIVVSGRNFRPESEVLFNSASVPTQFVDAGELRATLPNQTSIGTLAAQVRQPDPLNAGQHLLSNAVSLAVQAPVPPNVSIEPTPIALPPDNKARDITVRLSKADYRDHTIAFSISDIGKATVEPESLVIPAGQTTAKVSILPKAAGTTSLVADSATLGRTSVPLFITEDYRGANTAHAMPVGVVVESAAGPTTKQLALSDAHVGVSVGAVLTHVSPVAWPAGATATLVVHGAGVPADAQVSVVSAAGVSVGSVTVSGDGTRLQVALSTAADAPSGARRIVVKDGAGKDILFANAAGAVVQIMTGPPRIDSMQPIFAPRGTMLNLLVRGRHLQQAQVRVLPDTGIRVDAVPQVAADGSSLTVRLDIAADAPTGARVVQVVTPAGSTTVDATAANTFTVAASVDNTYTPVASSLVGVVVGSGPAAEQRPVLQGAPFVGVLTGAGISEVVPRSGVVGRDTEVVVRGAGLQAVTAVGLTPSAGIALVHAPSVNGDGTELRFTVRVDAGAVLGPRRLVFTATDRAVPYSRPADGSFLVAAPTPELISVQPTILRTGDSGVTITVRGRNFVNVTGARMEPPQGITVIDPFVAGADGTTLTFKASVAADAASGDRTLIVSTLAGESTAEQHGGNIVRIASLVGDTYKDLLSNAVGVVVGSGSPVPDSVALASTAVGVMVGDAAPPASYAGALAAPNVGVTVGPAARTLTPAGWLQGASGTITITGLGLDAVTSVSLQPATGVLLGAPAATGEGTQLGVSIAVAPDAPQVLRRLRLDTPGGTEVLFADPAQGRFGIGSLPGMSSVTPIVVEQGKGLTLVVRGSNLRGVRRVVFEPGSGVRATGEPAWSQDGFGELLTVPVLVDADAPLGPRVVRLEVDGGSTPAESTPANTINVVPPQ